MHQIKTKVMGVTKRNDDGENRQDIIKRLAISGNAFFYLEREANNPHDKNAISVWGDYDQIGYLSREVSENLAPHIDNGGYVKIANIRITGGSVDRPNMGVNITIDVKWTSSPGAI